MLPSTIPRKFPAPADSDQWADEVVKTMSLPSWVAFKRMEIGCEPSERIMVAKVILQRLGIAERSERKEYDISDLELLAIARSVVYRMRWHEDAQWALQQWRDGGFDPSQGDFVAVYLKVIRGYGSDPETLREHFAEQFGLKPQRIIVDCIKIEDEGHV